MLQINGNMFIWWNCPLSVGTNVPLKIAQFLNGIELNDMLKQDGFSILFESLGKNFTPTAAELDLLHQTTIVITYYYEVSFEFFVHLDVRQAEMYEFNLVIFKFKKF